MRTESARHAGHDDGTHRRIAGRRRSQGKPGRQAGEARLSRRGGNGRGALFIELDGMKPVNDRHGHRAGEDVRLFKPSLRERVERRYTLLERLGQAHAVGQLSLHYQPQFDEHTLQVYGLEALMRWHTPEDGHIPPADFIPLAIEHGLMPQLTVWAIGQPCRDNARLRAQRLLDAPGAVNLCLPCLAESGFVDLIATILPADRLEMEITEDVAMRASRRALQHANALHALGVHLAMDDFGVGFSSLGRLKSLQFSKLKIDRGFITGLPHDAIDRAIEKARVHTEPGPCASGHDGPTFLGRPPDRGAARRDDQAPRAACTAGRIALSVRGRRPTRRRRPAGRLRRTAPSPCPRRPRPARPRVPRDPCAAPGRGSWRRRSTLRWGSGPARSDGCAPR
ncbi:EAL domain-containing protein [Verticiella sediminum]|uniref:EAL domain-containing protein n=1 Tax=Verticiella sediminum TaxID=1247510 RepID=A0A556AX13_9BURK|nr:EAL domain-containing protein [Verticiella sediminum]